MSFKKQSLITLLLISIGSSIFAMEEFQQRPDLNTHTIETDTEKTIREDAERINREQANANKYQPTIIRPTVETHLSKDAVAALSDLKKMSLIKS